MKAPLVSVVILNLNGADYTLKCLASIRKSAFRDCEIIVVDNGSSDDSVEKLRKVKGIRLVTNKENLGFAEGCNVGVRAAKGRLICLLNNDTIVERNWLKALVDAAERFPDAAVFNPKLYDKYEAADYRYANPGTIGLFQAPISIPEFARLQDSFIRTLTASGSAFFRREIVGEPFDADYFAYAEDAQLGWRMNILGHKAVHVPGSIVYHEGGVTRKRMKVSWDFFFVLASRNKVMNMLTLYSGWTLLKLIPYFILYSVLANIIDPRHLISRLKVCAYFLRNSGKVLAKRRRLQSMRKVRDREIVKLMSCKLYDEAYVRLALGRAVLKAVNSLLRGYCWLVCLRTMEFHTLKVEGGILQPV